MRALVFPGQGAQVVGMGMELAEKYPLARDVLALADQVLGFALSDYIANGPEAELTRTDISQPAILTVSWMVYQVLKRSQEVVAFDACAGLSLGEYTAWLVAGAMDFPTALRLVRLRGQAMQAAAHAVPGGMVALIGASDDQAEALCAAARGAEELVVANSNAPGQLVIAGHKGACERALTLAKEHGIRRATALSVAGAFHSPLMAPAASQLREALQAVTFQAPSVPVYVNVSAEPVRDPALIAGLLERQLTSSTRWADSVRRMNADGFTQFLELGPGKTLCGMIARTVPTAQVANAEKPSDILQQCGG